MNMISRNLMAPILALCVTASTVTALAQSKSTSKSSKTTTTKKVTSKYHRLPTYYGQLKLKKEQVEEIYTIKDKFGPKIAELMKELEDLKEEQAEEIKDVLTRTQVTAYNKLVAGTAPKTSSSSSKSSSSKSRTSSKKTPTKK